MNGAHTETDSTNEDRSSSSFPQIHYQSSFPYSSPSTGDAAAKALTPKQSVVSKIAIKVSTHDGSSSENVDTVAQDMDQEFEIISQANGVNDSANSSSIQSTLMQQAKVGGTKC